MQTITFYVFTIFIIIGSLALGKFLVRETPIMITKIIYETIVLPVIIITKIIKEGRYKELSIITIYFISMILIITLLTLTKNDYLSISATGVAILNLQILIAKVGLIMSAIFLIIECIQLYIKNK